MTILLITSGFLEINYVFGTTLKCLQDFVIDNYGQKKWEILLGEADLPSNKVYHSIRFYPDSEFENLLEACSEELKTDKNVLL